MYLLIVVVAWLMPIVLIAKYPPTIDTPIRFHKRSTCPQCQFKF